MKFFVAVASLFLLQTSLGFGGQVLTSPITPGTSTLGYTCTDEDGERKCVCTGVSDCNRMKESGICRRQTGAHVWEDDFECNDATNTCSCTWPLKSKSGQRRPGRVGGEEKTAPGDNEKSSSRFHELGASTTFEGHAGVKPTSKTAQNTRGVIPPPDIRSSRRNESVIARRGKTPSQTAPTPAMEETKDETIGIENQLREFECADSANQNLSAAANSVGSGIDSVVGSITDPIADTLGPVGGEIGDAIESIEDGLGDLIGGDSDSDEKRDPVVDHRTGRKPPKQRRNETVPARRSKLAAPTNVTLTDCSSTSLVIRWRDNAKSEYGVHVERGTPANAGGKTRIAWRRIFSSEERVENRIQGIGERSDVDDGLNRGARYCYRLQAYRPDSVSDYSEIACTTLR